MLQHSNVSATNIPATESEACGVAQISRNWADLVKRARAKQLAPDEFQSGTFTISNLGNFGADIFDAILPPGVASAGVQGTPSMLFVLRSKPLCRCLTTIAGYVWYVSITMWDHGKPVFMSPFLAVLRWICQEISLQSTAVPSRQCINCSPFVALQAQPQSWLWEAASPL